MEARLFSVALVAAALLACGANYRSQNFIVHSSSSDQIAQEICTAAETYRRDLAIEWLGQELSPWRDPCPINLSRVRPQEPASGKTSFYFRSGEPYGWDMEVNGTRERVLDSVLPHEITHAIFATHFGRPLPRWADEGGSTTVEHDSEKAKQDHNLIRFLKGGKGIAFNQMFAMTEYPREMLPLYSQGYSLTRFLIQSGGEQGKRKFVSYVGDGMRQNNWTRATTDHYGYKSLSDLQIAWLEWVKQGSPKMEPGRESVPLPGKRLNEGLAFNQPAPRDVDPSYPTQPANRTRGIEDMSPAHNYQIPPRPSTFGGEPMQKSQSTIAHRSLAANSSWNGPVRRGNWKNQLPSMQPTNGVRRWRPAKPCCGRMELGRDGASPNNAATATGNHREGAGSSRTPDPLSEIAKFLAFRTGHRYISLEAPRGPFWARRARMRADGKSS
ncbi:MAG: hypothetical protein K8R36_10420 [Planctomycetales bacterium]|nr:hypothetical protein [Planctomycetales bacterium]